VVTDILSRHGGGKKNTAASRLRLLRRGRFKDRGGVIVKTEDDPQRLRIPMDL